MNNIIKIDLLLRYCCPIPTGGQNFPDNWGHGLICGKPGGMPCQNLIGFATNCYWWDLFLFSELNDQKSISHLKIVNISGQKSVAAHAALASTQLLYQAAFYPKTKCVCLTKAKIVSVVADPTFVIFLQKVNYFKWPVRISYLKKQCHTRRDISDKYANLIFCSRLIHFFFITFISEGYILFSDCYNRKIINWLKNFYTSDNKQSGTILIML